MIAREGAINTSRHETLISRILLALQAYTNQANELPSSDRGGVAIANNICVDRTLRWLERNIEGFTGGENVVVLWRRRRFIHLTPFRGLILNNWRGLSPIWDTDSLVIIAWDIRVFAYPQFRLNSCRVSLSYCGHGRSCRACAVSCARSLSDSPHHFASAMSFHNPSSAFVQCV